MTTTIKNAEKDEEAIEGDNYFGDELYDEKEMAAITYLLEKTGIGFPNKIDDYTFYSPYKHALSRRRQQHGKFTVHYAFPNGRNYPVASFWTHYKDGNGKDKPHCVNIDFSRVIDTVIMYFENNGYFAKPYEKETNGQG